MPMSMVMVQNNGSCESPMPYMNESVRDKVLGLNYEEMKEEAKEAQNEDMSPLFHKKPLRK